MKRLAVWVISAWIVSSTFAGPMTVNATETGLKLGVELGFDFASGDYGTGITTDSYSIPLKVRYAPTPRLDFELMVPFIYALKGLTTGSPDYGFGLSFFRNF